MLVRGKAPFSLALSGHAAEPEDALDRKSRGLAVAGVKSSPETVRKLIWSYFSARPGVIVGYVLLCLFYPIRVLAFPYVIGSITSTLEKHGGAASDQPEFWYHVYWILGLWALALAMQVGQGVFDAEYGPRFQMFVRDGAIGAILGAYRRNYRELETGDVNVKLFQLPYSAFWAVRALVNRILPVVITMVIALFMFFAIHHVFGWVFVGFLGVITMMYALLAIILFKTYHVASERLDRLHEEIDDFLGNLFSLYITDTVEHETKRITVGNESVRSAWEKVYYQKTAFRAGTTLIKHAFVAAMIAAMVYVLWKGDAKIGIASVLFLVFTLDGVVYDSIINFIQILEDLADLRKTEVYFDNVLADKIEEPDRTRCDRVASDGRLVFRDVSMFHPGADTPTINNVSLTIPARARVLVTGHIGSGKSTLMRLLAGLYPYTGSLTIDGHEVRDMSTTELRESVCLIPQLPRLFNRTLYENIVYGFDDVYSRGEIQALIDEIGVPNFPPLDKEVGKNGSALSGGQRTITYLIRGFLRRAKVVVLDEPTASLDAETKETVRKLTHRLFSERTLIVITHDLTVKWGHTMHVAVDHGTLRVTAK